MMVSQSNGQQETSGEGLADNTSSSTSDFKRLLTTEARFAPSPEVLATLAVKDYQALYDRASRDLEGFQYRIPGFHLGFCTGRPGS